MLGNRDADDRGEGSGDGAALLPGHARFEAGGQRGRRGDRVPEREHDDERLPSEYAGTNKATAVTWAVDDVEDTVRELKSKGIRFEHYDLPELTRQGDFYVSGEFRTAWFKDPDGNILSIVEE